MGVGRLSGLCGEVFWSVCGGCLDSLGRLSGGCGRLSEACGEAVWRVLGGCLEGMGRQS